MNGQFRIWRATPKAFRYSWAAALAACVGCGSDGPVAIAPRFTIDGQPLVEASISFFRTDGESGRASFGATDEQGVARLTTFKPLDGVLPGSYSVVVVKAPEYPVAYSYYSSGAQAAPSTPEAKPAVAPPQRGKIIHSTLPDAYGDPGRTPLKCTVTPDSADSEITFELTSKL